jgi:hypothetical protein
MFYIDESDKTIGNEHRTYKIKEGDTLYSVAEELDIDPALLRKYHNRYCEIPDLIEADFKSYLKFLILAPEKGEENGQTGEATRQKVIFSNVPFTLPFYPVNINNNYRVIYTIQKGEEVKRIGYEISINWMNADKNGICLFEIDKITELYINGTEADTKADELAEKAASVLYPLQVVVDQDGEWIDIHNFEEIQERWKKKRPNILEHSTGKGLEKYLSAVDIVLDSEEHLLQTLSGNWFLRAFFSGIHTDYTSKLTFDKIVDFAIIPNKDPIQFEVKQKIEEYLDHDNLIVIEQKGLLTDDDIKETYFIDPSLTSNYNAIYHLNPNNYTIEKIFLECNIALSIPKKVTVTIYNLNKKKEAVLGTRKPVFVAEVKKKESFFKGFWK